METTDSGSRGQYVPLDTNERCFLCLDKLQPEVRDEKSPQVYSNYHYPLHYLSRYLKGNETFKAEDTSLTTTTSSSLSGNNQNWGWAVALCQHCATINQDFLEVYGQLQKIELEMSYCLQRIHQKLDNSQDEVDDNNSQLVQELRGEVLKKCAIKVCGLLANVQEPTITTAAVNEEEEPSNSKLEMGSASAGSSKIECHICRKSFSRNFTLKRHYRRVHSVQPEVTNPSRGRGRIAELERKHGPPDISGDLEADDFETGSFAEATPIKVEEVDDCPFPSQSVASPKSDNEPKQRRYIINSESGKPQCRLCSMLFSSKTSFRDHYRSLHLHKRFRCETCDKEFRQKASLWRHNQGVHKGVRFSCLTCDRLFPDQSHLRSHQRTSISCGTEERHPCHICGKEYTRERTLQDHLSSVHLNSRDFLCSQCGKGFSEQRRLQRHVEAVHLKLKEHLCDLCGKKFNRQCHLKTHRLMVHQGKKSKSKKLKSND